MNFFRHRQPTGFFSLNFYCSRFLCIALRHFIGIRHIRRVTVFPLPPMPYLSSIDLHYTAHVVPVLTYDFDVQACKTFITTAAISCFYLIRPCHQCYFIDMLNNIFSSVIGYRITENDNIRIMQKNPQQPIFGDLINS